MDDERAICKAFCSGQGAGARGRRGGRGSLGGGRGSHGGGPCLGSDGIVRGRDSNNNDDAGCDETPESGCKGNGNNQNKRIKPECSSYSCQERIH